MSESFDFDDDFDPVFHTPEEIAARDEDRLAYLEWLYEHDLVYRARVDELAEMGGNMGTQQRALEQLADVDPVGMVWFGDDDEWCDKRLNTPEGGGA